MSEPEVILPRELTDISDEVRDVPPPPIPELPAPYGLRLADPDAEAEMIAEWMSRPHLAESWESVWPASRWQRYLRAQLASGFPDRSSQAWTEQTADTSKYTGQQRIPSPSGMSTTLTIWVCTSRSRTWTTCNRDTSVTCCRTCSAACSILIRGVAG